MWKTWNNETKLVNLKANGENRKFPSEIGKLRNKWKNRNVTKSEKLSVIGEKLVLKKVGRFWEKC